MFWIIFVPVLAFLLVLLVRALLLRPETVSPNPAPVPEYDREQAVSALQALIRCRTVSHADPAKDDEEEFEKLFRLLPELFPHVYSGCSLTRPGPRSLVFHWKGRSKEKPAVLMAHFDVVPVDPEGWEKPAFDGVIENGVLWGRGTLDTKCTFSGILQAADRLLENGFVPANDLYLCFSGSEEVNGDGAPAIVRWFQEQGIRLAFVMDEGGAIVEHIFPTVKEPAAVVGIAEKGTMAVRFSVRTGGGHASTPPAFSPIGRLARAVRRVENHPFPARLSPAARCTMEGLASHGALPLRLLFANLWFFRPLLYGICRLAGGELNALVRTTTAFTQMEGSSAFNVMPASPSITANVRINTGETGEDVIRRLKKIVRDDLVEIDMPYGRDPSPVSRMDGDGWQHILSTVRAEYPSVFVTPYLMLASSDSWNYCAVSDHVYRFSPVFMSREERAMIHGNNERIPLESYHHIVSFFLRLMQAC